MRRRVHAVDSDSGTLAETVPPIAGFPAAVHQRNNQHVPGLNGVEDCVRENMNEASSHVLLEHTPPRRGLGNVSKCGFDAGNKAKLEPRLTHSIETRGAFKFVQSVGMKLIPH
jgi:hypothetical protein